VPASEKKGDGGEAKKGSGGRFGDANGESAGRVVFARIISPGEIVEGDSLRCWRLAGVNAAVYLKSSRNVYKSGRKGVFGGDWIWAHINLNHRLPIKNLDPKGPRVGNDVMGYAIAKCGA